MSTMQFVKDYAVTVRANKVLAIGYGLLATSIAIGAQDAYDMKKMQATTSFAGTQLLCWTTGGAFTFRTIRRTREHIQKTGTIDERFQNKESTFYCNATAVEYVAQEQELEHVLTPDIMTTATITDCAKKWSIPAIIVTAQTHYFLH